MIHRKTGIDASVPINPDGSISPCVADPSIIANTGAHWARINFVLGAWTSPTDPGWIRAYDRIVGGLVDKGVEIYGLIGCEAVHEPPGDMLRYDESATPAETARAAHAWIEQYVENFVAIVERFRRKVKLYESFNEPDDWHGWEPKPDLPHPHWVHPYWFATMLEKIFEEVRRKRGYSDIKLVSGPLQGLEINRNELPKRYLDQAYQIGKTIFGWRPGSFPFDGVGYHLYVKEDWTETEEAIRETYETYLDGMWSVITKHEGKETDKKLYVSEFGWRSIDANLAEHEEFQARNLEAALEILRSDPRVGIAIWFCLQDFDVPLKSYGLYKSTGLELEDRKMPTYKTFKRNCREELAFYPLTFRIPTVEEALTAIGLGEWDIPGALELIEEKYGPTEELTPGEYSIVFPRRPLWGKGFWIWKLDQCEGGEPAAIADKAKSAGLAHVLVKIADGSRPYNGDLWPLVEALRTAGIGVWGWQYTYGTDPGPKEEAEFAASRVRQFGLDGFAIDAEREYKGHPSRATEYANALRAGLPNLPIALSSFYLPDNHPDFPWQEFLAKCDLNMPQVYWYSRDPVEALKKSLAQNSRFGKPIFPTGAAYRMTDTSPTPSQIRGFMEKVQAEGLSGVNFWSWQHATSEMWEAIKEFAWAVERAEIQRAYEMIAELRDQLNAKSNELEGLRRAYAEFEEGYNEAISQLQERLAASKTELEDARETIGKLQSRLAKLGWLADLGRLFRRGEEDQ